MARTRRPGIDQGVLDRVKGHLFEQEHQLPMPPDGHLVTRRFTPGKAISDLWEKADAGTLTAQDREQFQALMQHESVESSLMAQGLPYRSADPGAWEDGIDWPSAQHYGAHDIAPHAAYADDPRARLAQHGLRRSADDPHRQESKLSVGAGFVVQGLLSHSLTPVAVVPIL
jgi:hypothetical protein